VRPAAAASREHVVMTAFEYSPCAMSASSIWPANILCNHFFRVNQRDLKPAERPNPLDEHKSAQEWHDRHAARHPRIGLRQGYTRLDQSP
jgi:hypothetical protein